MKAARDPAFQQQLLTDPVATLAAEGIENEEDQRIVVALVEAFVAQQRAMVTPPELKDLQFTEMTEHYKTLGRLRDGLQQTIRQMLDGYKLTMVLYTISFLVGIGLVVAAVVAALNGMGPLLPVVFAGLGTGSVIGFMVTGPPLKIQRSRAELAQLQAAYFIWYQDFRHWGSFLTAEYYRYENNVTSSSDYRATLDDVSQVMLKNTDTILAMIQHYVEDEAHRDDPALGSESSTRSSSSEQFDSPTGERVAGSTSSEG